LVSFGAGNLRRERTSRLKAEKALDRAREEEIKLRAELERVVGELRETKEALSSKDASIGESGSKIRAAEGQPARAEAELRAGADVRDEAAGLIESELAVARSELASIREQSERAQRERDVFAAERDAFAAERDAIAAERDTLRVTADGVRGELDATRANLEIISREMAELGARYEESAARAAHAEATVLDLNADMRELEDRPDLTGQLERTASELEQARRELDAASQKVGRWKSSSGSPRRSGLDGRAQATRGEPRHHETT
jgi:chromosome segregation ATPase